MVEICDVSLYVMTCEFGAPTQLEKIDMLDFADLVALNKFERKGAEDALRNVRKQYRRNRNLFEVAGRGAAGLRHHRLPVQRPGTNVLYRAVLGPFQRARRAWPGNSSLEIAERESLKKYIIPPDRIHYLGEIVHAATRLPQNVEEQAKIARTLFQLQGARSQVRGRGKPRGRWTADRPSVDRKSAGGARQIIEDVAAVKASYRQDALVTKVRDKEIRTELYTTTLSGTKIPRVCLPDFEDWGEIVKWSMRKTLPGSSRTPPESSPSSGPRRIPSASSPARGPRSGPTDASTTYARTTTPSAFHRL